MLSKLELQQLAVAAIIGLAIAPITVGLKLLIPVFFRWITHYPRLLSPWLGPLWFLIPLAIGGLATGFVIYRFASEAAFSGLDSTISVYHDAHGRFRKRAAPVKFLATLFTLGSGGSGGLVGPAGFIGGSLGSVIGQKIKLERDTLKTFLLCGMAAGIASLMQAPFGAAIFAVEVCYVSNIVYKRFFYVLVSSVTAFYTTIQLLPSLFPDAGLSYQPFFEIQDHMKVVVTDAAIIPWLVLAAVLATVVSLVFVMTYRWIHRIFIRLTGRDEFEPLFGMIMTGFLIGALFIIDESYVFDTIGIGVRVIQDGIDAKIVVGAALVILIGKLVATSFTVGSGGSGGLFAPTLLLGAMTGITLSASIEAVIGVNLSLVLIAVGMSACLAATLNVPIAAIVIIIEIFGGEFAVPAIIGGVIGFLLTRSSYMFEKIRKETYGEGRYIKYMLSEKWRQ